MLQAIINHAIDATFHHFSRQKEFVAETRQASGAQKTSVFRNRRIFRNRRKLLLITQSTQFSVSFFRQKEFVHKQFSWHPRHKHF